FGVFVGRIIRHPNAGRPTIEAVRLHRIDQEELAIDLHDARILDAAPGITDHVAGPDRLAGRRCKVNAVLADQRADAGARRSQTPRGALKHVESAVVEHDSRVKGDGLSPLISAGCNDGILLAPNDVESWP